MITLALDCLLLETTSGEHIPFSPEMISAELTGDAALWYDAELLSHAANAVCHYFKHELGLQSVTAQELAEALAKAMGGFNLVPPAGRGASVAPGTRESDLGLLARDSGCELFFFARLRDELRQHLQHRPRILRFRNLRECVKQLAGVNRWGLRCRGLEEQVVSYLRQCVCAEAGTSKLALVVQ